MNSKQKFILLVLAMSLSIALSFLFEILKFHAGWIWLLGYITGMVIYKFFIAGDENEQ